MKKTKNTKLLSKVSEEYISVVFGFLIGTSIIVLTLSQLKVFEVLLVFFGFIFMVTDDWLLGRRFLAARPPKTTFSFFGNILFPLPFIFMMLSIALLPNDSRWLVGYPLGFLLYLVADETIAILSIKEHGKIQMPLLASYIDYIFAVPAIVLTYVTYKNLIPVYLTLILIPVFYFTRRLIIEKYLKL